MEVIPKATRQKGRLLFLALPPALRTQQLVGCRSTPSTPANSTRRLAPRRSSATPQAKIRRPTWVLSSTMAPAGTTRPMEHSRFFTTYKAATTRPSVLLPSRATLPAATTLRWGKAPAPVQQQVQVTSILAQEWRALLVKAMLLNEFLKAHSKMEEQEATIAQLKKELQAMAAHQQKQIETLAAGLQKVSAQLEASKPAPQIVNNN